jgi:alpha-mannosidase
MHSEPVKLDYDLTTASNIGAHESQGFDGKGNSLPAEMLPSELTFDDVKFRLAPAKSGVPNAVVAKGQSIPLPSGQFNRLYIVAASADGDQKASFELGGKTVELNIQDWGGFIGQWDDRQWSKSGANDDYGEMTAVKPGFIKRADLAWYDSNHRNAAGENVPYGYSYLFVYGIDVPPGTRSVKLPDNNKIHVLAMSVVQQGPELRPAQPLYDVLPSSHTARDVSLSSSTDRLPADRTESQ